MISGTFCGLGTYVFTHKTLTKQLATAVQERADAKNAADSCALDAEATKVAQNEATAAPDLGGER